MSEKEKVHPATEPDELRMRRLQQVAVLLRKWQAEDSTYDEEVGEILERELAQDPIRFREPDESAF